jgi:hypothetical protein
LRFVTINDNLIQAYLGSNIASIPDQLTGTVSLINEESADSLSVTDSMHYINKAIRQRNSDDDHISKDILNSLDEMA